MTGTKFTKIALLAALAAVPMMASAESDLSTGAGALTANARLDFRIIIPRFLYLSVGTSTALADNTTVNRVEFDVPVASLGTGAFAATSSTAPAYPIAVRLIGNGGPIDIRSTTTTAGLSNGAGDTIAWTTLTATAAGATPIPHPDFVNTGSTTVAVAPTSGTKITDRTGTWTYSYSNATVPAAGQYDGQVTYTALMP